jgi:hypothetical protein
MTVIHFFGHFSSAYHDYKNSDKHSNKVSEKLQGMLHIVPITKVSFLNDILGVNHHIAHKHQKPKIQLWKPSRQK